MRGLLKYVLGILPFAVVGIGIFYFAVLPQLAPVKTVKGLVRDIEFYSDWSGGEDSHTDYYTRVFATDNLGETWILRIGNHVPFEIGKTYTFEVRMWSCGSYIGTAVYPIADYSPRITPAPGSPLLFIVFIIISSAMFVGPMLLRYRRRR